jgi:tetratricopeptide (TPR) repeat protein
MDVYRQRKRTRRCVMDLDAGSLEAIAIAAGPSLEAAFLEGELASLMRNWILDMPPRLRSVAGFHLIEEMHYGEIADALAISEVNVRKRMQEARGLLRDLLRAYLAGDAGLQRTVRGRRSTGAKEVRPRDSGAERLTPGQTGRQIQALRAYIRKHPRGWKKRRELALLLRRSGDLEEAAELLHQAMERQPRLIAIALELGDVLEELGRTEEAMATYQSALGWARSEGFHAAIAGRIAALVARPGCSRTPS